MHPRSTNAQSQSHVYAGYVWNGLAHAHRGKATGGALILSCAAAAAHICLPAFESDKFALATALDLQLIEDPGGSRRRRAEAPPALPPFDASRIRAGLFALLPLKEVQDEEYDRMKARGSPTTISLRGKCDLLTHYPVLDGDSCCL